MRLLDGANALAARAIVSKIRIVGMNIIGPSKQQDCLMFCARQRYTKGCRFLVARRGMHFFNLQCQAEC